MHIIKIGGYKMHIGYVGPFSDSNFGDYAMLVNDMHEINVKNNTVFTYNTEFFKEITKEYLNDYNVEVVEVQVSDDYNYEEIKSNSYTVTYNNYPITPIEIISKINNKKEIENKIKKIDKLVVVGGGYFNDIWNANHRIKKLFSIIAPIIIANQMGKKIVFLGNTYGPFDQSKEFYSNLFGYL